MESVIGKECYREMKKEIKREKKIQMKKIKEEHKRVKRLAKDFKKVSKCYNEIVEILRRNSEDIADEEILNMIVEGLDGIKLEL